MDFPSNRDLSDVIAETWGTEEIMTVIVNNIYMEKFSFKSRPTELLRLV